MLKSVQDIGLLDQKLSSAFGRVANYLLRTKSEIKTLQPFKNGEGEFVFERGIEDSKPFTVSGRQSIENENIVHVIVSAKGGKTLPLDFDTARDAFIRPNEELLSVKSAKALDSFMRSEVR
jgi:hypothetical protein